MAENRALIPEPVNMYTQSESLKDAKDLSKNLMSGDFERQYTEMEKSNKRRGGCVILGVTIGALAVWLLVLTVVREIQLSRLQAQVDGLSASMMEMTLNVVSLNTKVSSNRLFNEFKTLEDTIYADEDQDGNLVEETTDSSKEKQSHESLEKIKGLTVLEDDSQFGDDEDMYDGDEGTESGDWYPDYDARRKKIGTSDLMSLTPEDFKSSIIILREGRVAEIRKRINENPEDDVIELAKASSEASSSENISNRDKRSVFPDAAAEMITDFDPPKVMTKMDERHKAKKSPSINMEPLGKMTLHPVSRTARNSNNEEGNQRRPFIAAHFHGNTSHLSTEIHEHYKGNGLVRVAHGAPHDVWYPSPWTIASPHPRPTLTRNGHIHIHHTGVYFVYAQIYYLDSHDIISWVLHRTSPYSEGRDTLLQCAQSSHTAEPLDKPNSCFSAAALFLKAGDRLAVRNTGGDRHSLMEPEKSFIGLVKLADADEPNDEF